MPRASQSTQAQDHPPRYFQSPDGTWIECDWEPINSRYICKPISGPPPGVVAPAFVPIAYKRRAAKKKAVQKKKN
jgi:hypothetical protein